MLLKNNQALHQLVDAIKAELETHDLFFGHGTNNAGEEASWLGLYATKQDLSDSELDWEIIPKPEQVEKMQALLSARINSKQPFAYLINEAWFCGLRFYVDERTIVPRSYFGEWIPEQFSPWVNANQVHRILDLCTGSGCIAIALAYAFERAQIDATDLSQDALAVANINVKKNDLCERVHLHQTDLFSGLNQKYDLICSNPPYISSDRMENLPDEYLTEPDMAFRGGEQGLDLVDIILAHAADYLNEEGVLVVEVGTAALALEAKYPSLAFTWLSTDDEAMAIFLLQKNQLPQTSKV